MTSFEQQASPAHQIRLVSQWDLETVPATEPTAQGDVPDVQRLQHVSDYTQYVNTTDGVRYRLVRRFGRPSGVTSQDRIELAAIELPAHATVSLNDHVLQPLASAAGAARIRFDVSALLKERNVLAIALDVPPSSDLPATLSDVRLAIFNDRQASP